MSDFGAFILNTDGYPLVDHAHPIMSVIERGIWLSGKSIPTKADPAYILAIRAATLGASVWVTCATSAVDNYNSVIVSETDLFIHTSSGAIEFIKIGLNTKISKGIGTFGLSIFKETPNRAKPLPDVCFNNAMKFPSIVMSGRAIASPYPHVVSDLLPVSQGKFRYCDAYVLQLAAISFPSSNKFYSYSYAVDAATGSEPSFNLVAFNWRNSVRFTGDKLPI